MVDKESLKARAEARAEYLVKQFEMMAAQAAEQRMRMQEGPEPMSDEEFEKKFDVVKAQILRKKGELN
jgi:hypothetical protein